MPPRKNKPLSLNLALINGPMDEEATQDFGIFDGDNQITYRHDGMSIGRDFLRFEGNTLSRGEFGTALMEEHTLGRGACSRVVKATYQQHDDDDKNAADKPVALKQFPLSTVERRDMLSKELQALAKMDCESLVKLLGAFFEENTVTLVLEYMDRGSLANLLDTGGKLPERVAAAVAFQTLWGLSYLHFESRLHRDVKPANILLHSNGSVKLSDFGISSELNVMKMNTTVVGTTMYMALERLRAKAYGTPSDVWSLGLVLCECLTGVFLFADIRSVIELVVTLEEDIVLPKDDCYSQDARQLLMGCLQVTPEKRMPATILLKSPWFDSVGIATVDDAKSIVKEYLASS
jgi:serine/threonine protein kinase